MSKPWSKIGAWAADVEAEEAAAAATSVAANSQSFPTLKDAVTVKPKKKKMSLSEFYSDPDGGGIGAARVTTDEMLRLPTGPKERSSEELQYGRLGGGFSSCGRSGPPSNRMRDREDSDGSWSGGGRRSYGGFDDKNPGSNSRLSEIDQFSRADEVDNWTMGKKPLPVVEPGRSNRYGSLGGGGKADEADNWAMGKKLVAIRSSTFGSGFRASGPRVEPDQWSRGGGFSEADRQRPRLVVNPPKAGEVGGNEILKVNKPNPFGAARPREEVLAEKGLDWKKMEADIDAKKKSRPTSAHSSRPSSSQSSRSESQGLQGIENVVKVKQKVNPFGGAKPREVLLEEKSRDWRKKDMELEHGRMERPETDKEILLKEELVHLNHELAKASMTKVDKESQQGTGNEQLGLQEIIVNKEKELDMLIHDLDDKVWFGQKATERPSSGAGRGSGYGERPPSSHSGTFAEPRSVESMEKPRSSVESMERPRSRGKADVWSRTDDRRGTQGGRERGFLSNSNLDRPRSRERW